MGEENTHPKPSGERTEKSFRRPSIREIAGKARELLSREEGGISISRAALGGAAVVGAAALAHTASKPNQPSGPEPKPVPVERIYSSDSIPADFHFETNTLDGRTQELLSQMGNNEIISEYSNTVAIFPAGTELQYTPDPSDLNLPGSAKNIVKRLKVPEGFVAAFIRYRDFGLGNKEQYLNASQIPDDANGVGGRAVELEDNLFIKQTTADGSAELFAIGDQPPGPAEGGVDRRGNPTFPPAVSSKTAVVLFLNKEGLAKLKQQLKLHPDILPPPAG